jgi:hypothetical protein
LCSVVFLACKKDKPVVDPCTTLATTLAVDISNAQILYATYLASPTPANCIALKNAATSLTAKASICPAVIAKPEIQVLIKGAAALNCTQN